MSDPDTTTGFWSGHSRVTSPLLQLATCPPTQPRGSAAGGGEQHRAVKNSQRAHLAH